MNTDISNDNTSEKVDLSLKTNRHSTTSRKRIFRQMHDGQADETQQPRKKRKKTQYPGLSPDEYYKVRSHDRINTAKKKYQGSLFCPSFFDLTDGDCLGIDIESRVHPDLTTNSAEIQATAYKNAFVIRAAGKEYLENALPWIRDPSKSKLTLPSKRHLHKKYSFHPLSCSKKTGQYVTKQDILFPSRRPVLLSCGHLVCEECMVKDPEIAPHEYEHGWPGDNCWNNFYQKHPFHYDHSKYLYMQRLCVDGYVRKSEKEFNDFDVSQSNRMCVDGDDEGDENDLNGIIIPWVINGIINKYMPQKEKWECYYGYMKFWDNSEKRECSSKRNKWE